MGIKVNDVVDFDMKPSKSDVTSPVGTPSDYSEDLYRFYFELIDKDKVAKEIITQFLGEEHAVNLTAVEYGYEFNIPIQCAPEIVRLLQKRDIAIYQVVRLARTPGIWRAE
jgi:hypothetical protein